MNLDLRNKTALVCGASQGIGAAVAHELASLGANVILLARNENKLQQVLARLYNAGEQQHTYLQADTHKTAELIAVITNYLSSGNTIHILVNNTGGPPSLPLIETSVGELEAAFRSHLIASHVLVQSVIGGMKATGYGRIINILSTAVKEPINGLGISNTIRAAVANWAKTLANEIAQFGITVNNILPGFTQTERLQYFMEKQASSQNLRMDEVKQHATAHIPAGRLGNPEELAAVVAFLCSPAAGYINGINLPVDGGRLGGL